jgi:adenylyltransferase/sulfurtransferase
MVSLLGVEQISVRQLHEMLARGEPVYLIDVRQPWEHALARLPGDVLAPLDQLADQAEELTPPADALIVTYCHHGIRSLNAAAMLEKLGHARVASLAGGIDRWSLDIDPSVPRY